jgi:thymidylate synthase
MQAFLAGKGNYGPIVIVADTLAEAWEKAVIAIMKGGYDKFVKAPEYQCNTKECQMFIFVTNPMKEPRLHPKAMFDRSSVEQYAKNLIFGIGDPEKENAFDYTYYSRLRCYPDCEVRADWPNVVKEEDIEKKIQELSQGKCVLQVIDQVQMAIETFKRDPTRRSVVLHTWIPKRDLDKFSPKRIKSSSPCLTLIQPQINDEKLHFVVVMKTNDLFSAWPENAYAFTELQKYMAEQIGVGVGSYTHFSVSMQIYEDMFEFAKQILENPEFVEEDAKNDQN